MNDWKNEKVNYNGKDISKYEASQIQRRMERTIRQDKKDIAGLNGILTSNNQELIEETQDKLIQAKQKMQLHNSAFNNFLNQTGLEKDYIRLKI